MTGPTGMASESVPELSVVLCTLNGERTIAAQLCALAAQVTESSFETIVVDNGSTDRTAAIVRKFIGGPRPVRLVAAPDRPNLSYARTSASMPLEVMPSPSVTTTTSSTNGGWTDWSKRSGRVRTWRTRWSTPG